MKIFKLLLITSLLLYLTGCEEKKSDSSKVTTKNTQERNAELNNTEENNTVEPKYTFMLSDINETNRSVTIENKHIEISNVSENVILLNFFATWCPPCKGEIPYLADLKNKYKGKIFVAGILVNDTPEKAALHDFFKEYGVNYFVSVGSQNNDVANLAIKKLHLPKDLPIPLTILFKDGHYYAHYEGAVPIEMLEHDIKNVLHKD